MGRAKALLDWHGRPLVVHVCEVVGAAVGGPVVVVGSAGQELPRLPEGTELVTDSMPDRGPLQGLVDGLVALSSRADVALVAGTDVPFLRPAVARHLLAAVGRDADVAVPVVGGRLQPLLAAYSTDVIGPARELLAAGERKMLALLEQVQTRELSERDLLDDPEVRRDDPGLRSVVDLDTEADYLAALKGS
jgi:molybdopterin-guanine dinucleotide biosynthesis protein A